IPGFSAISPRLAVSLEYIDDSGISHTKVVTYTTIVERDDAGGGDVDANGIVWGDDDGINFVPSEWQGKDITVTIAYNFGANVSATEDNYIVLSDLKYKLRFTSTLDVITYNWTNSTKSWDGQLVYSRSSKTVKKSGAGSLDLRIGDITATKVDSDGKPILNAPLSQKAGPVASGGNNGLYTAVGNNLYGYGKGFLRLLDGNGNYTDILVDIAYDAGKIVSTKIDGAAIAAGSIVLPATPVSTITNPAGGTSSVTPATFAPTRAVFYLKNVLVKINESTDATLDVEVIGFNVTNAEEQAYTSITAADIVKASDPVATKDLVKELFIDAPVNSTLNYILATADLNFDPKIKTLITSGGVDTPTEVLQVGREVINVLTNIPVIPGVGRGGFFGHQDGATSTVTFAPIYKMENDFTAGVIALFNQVQLPTGPGISEGFGDIFSGKSAVYKTEGYIALEATPATSVGTVTIEQGTGIITVKFGSTSTTNGFPPQISDNIITPYIVYLTVKTVAGQTVDIGISQELLSLPLGIRLVVP
ncbi:hypothetical protein EZS27_029223, partial [termite gut metagenome]